MAKKRKPKARPFTVKFIIVCLLVIATGFGTFKAFSHFVKKSEYFNIKTIVLDSSLQFINRRDLDYIKGKNLFAIDLKSVHRKLSYKYPQISLLKIIKRFPNKLHFQAERRYPYAQTLVQDRRIMIDESGLILSVDCERDKKYPIIIGIRSRRKKIERGMWLRDRDIQFALNIISAFQSQRTLSEQKIEKIDVSNLSKISVHLVNRLKIIMDKDKIKDKAKMLGIVFAQSQFDLKKTKYIDLRFKEPILGKK